MPLLAPGDLARAGLAEDGHRAHQPAGRRGELLRTSLRPGLLKALAYNESHRNLGVSLFEIGHVYRRPPPGEPLPDEREVLGAALAGRDARRPAAVAWARSRPALGVDDVSRCGRRAARLHPTRTLPAR